MTLMDTSRPRPRAPLVSPVFTSPLGGRDPLAPALRLNPVYPGRFIGVYVVIRYTWHRIRYDRGTWGVIAVVVVVVAIVIGPPLTEGMQSPGDSLGVAGYAGDFRLPSRCEPRNNWPSANSTANADSTSGAWTSSRTESGLGDATGTRRERDDEFRP